MRRFSLLVVLVVALVAPVSPAQAAAPPLATSIASTGDSITRAYDASVWGCFLADCTRYSWSTGSGSSVASHYRRLAAAQPGVAVAAYNDARTGAKMVELQTQLQNAAAQRVQYATVLMGANDLCTSTTAAMTAPDVFRAEFKQALAAYFTAAPAGSRIFVSSIPNLYQLWSLLRYNATARSTWQSFGICQSMLSLTATSAQRQAVVDREAAFNTALAEECAVWLDRCRWDQLATFQYQFQASDVSTVDYFHPSISGQNNLAGITWRQSYWGP